MQRYIVITPVRDEEKYIELTLQSFLSQTVKPVSWIIVNDGSKDRTEDIIESYKKKVNWIRIINKKNRGYRARGGGVVEAFYCGYDTIKQKNYDFIAKMDGDLKFDKYYFELLLEKFNKDKTIGIAGGACYNEVKEGLKIEKQPLHHVRGATKVYRRKCFEEIKGLVKAIGWDTADEMKANMLGWKTRTFPELKIVHLRKTGQSEKVKETKMAKGAYFLGYHPIYVVFKGMIMIFRKPFLYGSVIFLFSYIKECIYKRPRIDDIKLIKYIRRQQIKRILLKESLWK